MSCRVPLRNAPPRLTGGGVGVVIVECLVAPGSIRCIEARFEPSIAEMTLSHALTHAILVPFCDMVQSDICRKFFLFWNGVITGYLDGDMDRSDGIHCRRVRLQHLLERKLLLRRRTE